MREVYIALDGRNPKLVFSLEDLEYQVAIFFATGKVFFLSDEANNSLTLGQAREILGGPAAEEEDEAS